MMYDGTGRRISKTRARKEFGGDWETELVTHYTGIGTEVRENPVNGETKVVVNLPNGLGRYMPEDASAGDFGFGAGYMPPEKFEWYLKNHLGSTMLVYGTQGYSWTDAADVGAPIAAYDYRAFGEQVSLAEPSDKVTENFTGKERDDETELDYFGARYLDPMLGMWTSVDPKRQFASPYLYVGNGVNPVNGTDGDGNYYEDEYGRTNQDYNYVIPDFQEKVSVEDMDAILSAHETLQGQLGLLDYILPSYALKSYMYDREIAFSLNDVSEYTVGDQTSVATENLGKNVFHLHSFRYNGSKEGFSSNDYVMCNYYCRSDFMMEITSGNVYFQNVNANNREYPGVKQNLYGIGKEFLLMNIPLPNYTPNR